MEEKLTDSKRLTHYYRWQFLRLNKRYRRESDLYRKGVEATKRNRKLSDAKKREVISSLENKLYKQYGINGIYDYRTKIPKKGLRIYGIADFAVQKGTLKGIFGGILKDNQEIFGNHLLETIRRTRKVKKGKKIFNSDVPVVTARYAQVVINFDAELVEIQRAIKGIVNSARIVRREVGVKRAKTRSQKTKIDYENYLRVWKLHKDGKRNIDIANIIFSKQDGRGREDKVTKYLTRAEDLIGGDYRKIKF